MEPILKKILNRVRKKKLANGLRILTLKIPSGGTVCFQVWYKVGSRYEKYGQTGLSHFLEHLMFKGTSKVGAEKFAQIIQGYGGTLNAYTTEDFTTYYEEFPTEALSEVVFLEADRSQNLNIDEHSFEIERKVILEERRLHLAGSPFAALYEELHATAFKIHPYRNPVIGWQSDLESITWQDLYQYYKDYYTPSKAVITVVGDFKELELYDWLQEYFQSQISDLHQPSSFQIPSEPPQTGYKQIEIAQPVENLTLALGFRTPSFNHPDSYPLMLLASILSDGRSSRLYHQLVQEKKLCLFASGQLELRQDPSLLYVFAGLLPEIQVEEFRPAFWEEIEQLKTKENVKQEEFKKAKQQILVKFISLLENNSQIASVLGKYEILGKWSFVKDFIANIEQVGLEQIPEIAEKYLSKQNCTEVLSRPE